MEDLIKKYEEKLQNVMGWLSHGDELDPDNFCYYDVQRELLVEIISDLKNLSGIQ